ncbi:hypothetical protein AB0F43_32010 [Kribbella sp. NPDC023972]|uniref:hypothetical protein n=1 Tax=Kribbella sp. NPDC023972 TaxID=3154795 RepID=UPI0033D1A82D
MTGTSAAAVAGLGHRGEVTTVLSYLVDQAAAGQTPGLVDWTPRSPWDIWWICFRSGSPAETLGLRPAERSGGCAVCAPHVVELTRDTPMHPGVRPDCRRACFTAWAASMRSPEPVLSWPRISSGLAMVKPGGDAAAVVDLLAGQFVIEQPIVRILSTHDVRRLYPEAYGADFIAARDHYLTSAPCTVLTLRAKIPTPAGHQRKHAIREILGNSDPLRNHLHMPDNPGETWCDLRLLSGSHDDLYRRYDSADAAERLDHYRRLLGVEQAGPRRC